MKITNKLLLSLVFMASVSAGVANAAAKGSVCKATCAPGQTAECTFDGKTETCSCSCT